MSGHKGVAVNGIQFILDALNAVWHALKSSVKCVWIRTPNLKETASVLISWNIGLSYARDVKAVLDAFNV